MTLQVLIKEMAPQLKVPEDGSVEADVLLAAIAYCESSFGQNAKPRVEPAYLSGRYARVDHVAKAIAKYGEKAACSYGPWQVLYITALELGFKGTPDELADPRTNLEYAIKYLNQRAYGRGAKTVAQYADCYNSGDHRDRFVPTGYVRKCVQAYNGIARQWLNS